MLIKRSILEGIQGGRITLAFRRWKRPTVKAGGQLRTRVGVLEILSVREVSSESITEEQAAASGAASCADLRDQLHSREGQVYEIRLRYAGEDPRIALRERSVTLDEWEGLRSRLERMDRRSTDGPWTQRTLELISSHPGVRAVDIAASIGSEKKPFKARVRRLKELGLTESLKIGYRLSPRGESVLHLLK